MKTATQSRKFRLPPPPAPEPQYSADVPRDLLRAFVARYPVLRRELSTGCQVRLDAGHDKVRRLLVDDLSSRVPLSASEAGWRSLSALVMRSMIADVNSGRESELAELGEICNRVLRRLDFDPYKRRDEPITDPSDREMIDRESNAVSVPQD